MAFRTGSSEVLPCTITRGNYTKKKVGENMNTEDIIYGITKILNMSEMIIETNGNVIIAELDDKRFRIKVEDISE